jgi:hypothetical protein
MVGMVGKVADTNCASGGVTIFQTSAIQIAFRECEPQPIGSLGCEPINSEGLAKVRFGVALPTHVEQLREVQKAPLTAVLRRLTGWLKSTTQV